MRSSRIPESTELAILKANGALLFQTEMGSLWAVFDDTGVRANFSDAAVNSTSPQLTCRSCDVERLQLNVQGAAVSRETRAFEVRELIPDGTGSTVLILDEVS